VNQILLSSSLAPAKIPLHALPMSIEFSAYPFSCFGTLITLPSPSVESSITWYSKTHFAVSLNYIIDFHTLFEPFALFVNNLISFYYVTTIGLFHEEYQRLLYKLQISYNEYSIIGLRI
jgi:hypothetical protein